MTIITYKFKIRNGYKKLNTYANKVNYIWNYCNQTSIKAIQNGQFLSEYDFHPYLKGTSKVLNISSHTIQSICEHYVIARKTFKKRKLKWRHSYGSRKSLGWIPFKSASVQIKGNKVFYCKQKFTFYKSREIDGKIKSGTFVQDSCGDWFICLYIDVQNNAFSHKKQDVGIDLGIKNILTTSDGDLYENPKILSKWEKRLKNAQRFKNKKKFSRLHRKIARIRKDNLHKISSIITKTYKNIYVGDLSLKMNKSTNDASFRGIIPLLKYKAGRLNGCFNLVNEANTSLICSKCLEKTGPKGLGGLSVREWTCASCGQMHSRDINAAKNILRLGYEAPKTLDKQKASLKQGLLRKYRINNK